MKIRERLFVFVLALALCAFAGAAIAGCGETEEGPSAPDAATALKFDFATGEYSFTGVSDASYYFLRVYAKAEAEESGVAAATPVGSSRISASDGNSYSGTLTIELDPGVDYSAYVFSYAEDGITYSLSDPVSGYMTSTYATPELTTSNIRFDIAEDGNSATVTLTNNFLSSANTDCAPDYTVKVYAAETGGDAVETLTVKASDIKEETEDSGGPKGPTITRTAEFTIELNNVTSHWITITIVSTDQKAYNDSEESNRLVIAQSSEEEPGGGDNPKGGTK